MADDERPAKQSKFVIELISDVVDKSHKGNVSAIVRQKDFLKETYVDDGKLFCTICNKVIDHSRKSTVEAHMKTGKHIKRKDELEQSKKKITVQKTVPTLFKTVTGVQQARAKVTLDWVEACTAANIPQSKTDNLKMREFIQTNVKNGGAIPGGCQLQNIYMPELYKQKVDEIKQKLKAVPICVIFDEMSDDEGRYILNILACPISVKDKDGLLKSYLLDTCFLPKTNHSTVGQAVVQVLNSYNVTFNDVIVFDTDNAAYMKKTYTDILKGLYPKSIHCTCLAHIINLVGEAFRKPLEELDKFVRYFSQQFFNAGGRKKRYLDYLISKNRKPAMPPDPVGTRWNSWFYAVQYHEEHWSLYSEYIMKEKAVCGNNAPNSIVQLNEMQSNELIWNILDVTVRFVADVCKQIIYYLGYFESQRPCALHAYEKLEELQIYLEVNAQCTDDTAEKYFESANIEDDLPLATRRNLISLFNTCSTAAAEKLSKYLADEDGQPALSFLKSCRIFNPMRVSVLSPSKDDYLSIPDFSTVPMNEFNLYLEVLAKEAVLANAGKPLFDTDVFWSGVQDRVPTLASLALRYKDAITNSADAERSNSLYNIVLSDRRRFLSEESLKELVFLYFNSHAWKHTESNNTSHNVQDQVSEVADHPVRLPAGPAD